MHHMYCAVGKLGQLRAHYVRSEHALEHDEITVKLQHTIPTLTKLKHRAEVTKCFFPLVSEKPGKYPAKNVCSCTWMPCITTGNFSKVFKVRQPLESMDNLPSFSTSPIMMCALLSLWGGFIFKFIKEHALLRQTPVCLHEELERICSCQLSASVSSLKEGSAVSLLILKV